MTKRFLLIALPLLCLSCSQSPVLSSSQSDVSSDSSSMTNSSEESISESSSEESSSSVHIHDYTETIVRDATLLEKGLTHYECAECGDAYDEAFYDLSQFVFEDQTFQYDGLPHQVTIKGLLPLGVTVGYETNEATEIGSQSAKANLYDEEHNLLLTKEASIHIVENTGFPLISVDTDDVAIENKETYVPMSLSVSSCDPKYELEEVSGGIRLRGNGTLTYDKKAYRVKFDSKTNLLGLNGGAKMKSWVLIADYADQSMMRNASAYYMGDSLFNYSGNYCSDYTHVSLMLNDSYEGVYLLAEQQQANKNRINLEEAEEDYTGTDIGYLLELDNYAKEEDYHFAIGNNWGDRVGSATLQRKEYSIKTDCFDDGQVTFIKKYLSGIYSCFISAVTGKGLSILDEDFEVVDSPYETAFETLDSMIDLESLFKTYLLHEIIKSVDVGYSSFYLFVDFSENSEYPRLTFGAPWDFDWSSGNANVSPAQSATGSYNSSSFQFMNPWLYLLSKTDFFASKFPLYYQVFSNSGIYDGVFAQANYEASAFADEFAHNYERWETLGTIIPKYTPDAAKDFKTHKDAVDYLTSWLTKRKTYLDGLYLA